MSSGSIFDPANYIRHLEQQTRDQAETIKALNETIEELRQTVANLRETLDELNRKLFGKSSEQIRPQPPEDGTAEDTAGSGGQEIHVKEHIRERQSKSPRDDLYKSIPVRRIECPASEDQLNCPDCDALMEHLGWQFVREEIRITMAKVERIQYFRETLVCPECNAHIDRNSTKPIDSSDREHTEEAIEKTFRTLSRINYVFLMCPGLFVRHL